MCAYKQCAIVKYGASMSNVKSEGEHCTLYSVQCTIGGCNRHISSLFVLFIEVADIDQFVSNAH